MSAAKPHPSETFRNVDPALQPLVETLNAKFKNKPLDLPAIKNAMIALLEFLSSPAGRNDANCRAVDGFFSHDKAWLDAGLPDSYHDVIAHMDALDDTIIAPHIARDFDSTPDQLLVRARNL